MAKRKLQRFAELDTFSNVFHFGYHDIPATFPLKGKWNDDYFKNKNPIVAELGCGKGEYTVGLSELFPEKNFVGIDLKGARLWRGSKTSLENNIAHTAFVRTRIDFIEHIFAEDELSEIWLTFPDPQPRESRIRKRLTSQIFLDRYKKVLRPGGLVHLKTDNEQLYRFTLEMIEKNNFILEDSTENLYASATNVLKHASEQMLEIKTFYEKKFLGQGMKIFYLNFSNSPYAKTLTYLC